MLTMGTIIWGVFLDGVDELRNKCFDELGVEFMLEAVFVFFWMSGFQEKDKKRSGIFRVAFQGSAEGGSLQGFCDVQIAGDKLLGKFRIFVSPSLD